VDTRFLDEVAGGNLEVWRHDVVRDPMPENTFDLVHVRSLLMHLPERLAVLERLVSALRPGGWLVVEESDVYPVLATATGPYREAWAVLAERLGRAGMAAAWTRELPSVLAGMGLAGVAGEAEVHLFPGGSPWAQLNQLTFLQAGAALTGEAARRLGEAVAALDDPAGSPRWPSPLLPAIPPR
jgi:SAM-dependent methyltransferase